MMNARAGTLIDMDEVRATGCQRRKTLDYRASFDFKPSQCTGYHANQHKPKDLTLPIG